MTGKRIYNWLVLERDSSRCGKGTYWICECQCENKTVRSIGGVNLRRGKSKCCGCYKKPYKTNKYIIEDDYVIGYTFYDEEFLLDLEDLEKVNKYYWHKKPLGYMSSKKGKREIKLHRLIMDAKDGEVVDHINHNPADNRKSNLRKVTHQQNMFNKVKYKNNKSGYKGVVWNKRDQKWVSRISINKKQVELGRFHSLEEAVKVRKEAEVKYYGDYRYIE